MADGLLEAKIRDFSGGWNVADSDLNLNSKYQPISENIMRGVDGSFYPRWGTALVANFATGTATTLTGQTKTLTTTLSSARVKIAWNAHGLSSGNHITISGAVAVGGITADEINRTHSVLVTDANTLYICTRSAATATASVAMSGLTLTTDNHLLGGNIIHDHYFNRRLLVFTDIGEIGSYDTSGLLARIWDFPKANALTGNPDPCRACLHWSSATFKSTVIACNGYDKDKPVQIDADFNCEFLVDKATSSNAAVPKADFVLAQQGYVALIRTEYGDPYCEFSARGTDGTFTRETAPADATEVDLSLVTSSVEPVLLGGSSIRDKMYLAFYDRGMIGTLGIYDDAGNHNPDFGDTISEHGTIGHRTMVSLGNDIFMCDYAGVPSVSISQASGIYVPVRVSELIAPAIQKHLMNLSEDTLRRKAFAVYSKTDRAYMLFLPKYDEITQDLDTDPFVFNDELRALNYALVYAPQHKLIERSKVTIVGATDIGTLAAADINGVRAVVNVVDEDTFVVELGGAPASDATTSGGGDSVSITPINDETLVYAFEYNKELKIRRWTRYRDWDFDCACISQRGKVYMGKGLKVYRIGDYEEPVYADFYNDYDEKAASGAAYSAGTRVLENSTGNVYIALVDVPATHTAGANFAAWRAAYPDDWEPYLGEEIFWELETPWSDLQHRGRLKINKYIKPDTEGTGSFSIAAFVNEIQHDPTTNVVTPVRELQTQAQFAAGDTGGFGMAHPGFWSGGRRTREEKVWAFDVRGKLIRWRITGRTKTRLKFIALTMYYRLGNIR